MAKRGKSVSDHLALADKAAKGDRAAAFELAELLHPVSITEFVELVAPDGLIRTVAFDALADALDAYTHKGDGP